VNDATFEQLLAHASFVRGLARELAGDSNEAEEVAQDAFAAAIEHPPRHFDALRSWLAALTRNAARRRWRGETRRTDRERKAARPEELPSSASIVAREEILRRMVEAVLALQEPYRSTVLLRFYENLPPRRIAARMGVAVDTVHTRLRRAMAMLREALRGSDPDWRSALVVLSQGGSFPVAAKVALAVVLAAPMGWLGISLATREPGQRLEPVLASDVGSRATSSSAVSGPDGGRLRDVGDSERIPGTRQPTTTDSSKGAAESRLVVSGRVVDVEGMAFAGATIGIGAAEDPFDARCEAPQVAWSSMNGRVFTTDAAGRFSAEVSRSGRVLVRLMKKPHYAAVDGRAIEREVEPPCDDLEFVVQRVGVATIVVRAELAGSRKPIENFVAVVHGEGNRSGYYQRRADGDRARFEIPVDGEPHPMRATLLVPEHDPRPQVELVPQASTEHEIVLVVPVEDVVSGYVVDRDGGPIAGALVHFGDATVGRGDEPFRDFRPERVAGGERTGADGWFQLAGSGELVTAWHERFTGATVAASAAARIVLEPRARIVGTVVDEQGQRSPSTPIMLDEGTVAVTDAEGKFTFDGLEARAHSLRIGEDRRAAPFVVRLTPGEEREVELVLAQGSLELEFTRGGVPIEMFEMHGALLGLEDGTGLHEISHWRPRTDDPAELDSGFRSGGAVFTLQRSPDLVTINESVAPGRYLLVSSEGHVAPVEVRGPHETVELGTARLTVAGRPKARFHLVPAGSDELVRLVAARCAVSIPDPGQVELTLPQGPYDVIGARGAVLGRVDLGAALTSFRLPGR
jgi:RNA polymerase sigma factor (sigma-70 family)